MAGAGAYPPLYVGYYQDQHYQSLEWVGEQQQDREEAGQGVERQQEEMREELAADPERDSAIAEILVEMVAEAVVQAAVRLGEINLVKAQKRGGSEYKPTVGVTFNEMVRIKIKKNIFIEKPYIFRCFWEKS